MTSCAGREQAYRCLLVVGIVKGRNSPAVKLNSALWVFVIRLTESEQAVGDEAKSYGRLEVGIRRIKPKVVAYRAGDGNTAKRTSSW